MGFSFIGTIIGMMILLPSILFFAWFPPRSILADLPQPSAFYTILERVGQILCLTVLIMSKNSFQYANINVWTGLMLVCIVIYYGLWIRYIIRGQEYLWLWKSIFFIPIPLAVFPVLAYGFAAIWGKSIWLGIGVVALAIGHLNVSWHSYKHTL